MDIACANWFWPAGKWAERLKEFFSLKPGETPLTELIVENRKNGELIISQLRLLVIFFLVPAFILRIYQGEFLHEYIYFTSMKLSLIFLIYLWIYQSLKKGRYHESIGYVTILLDTFFLTFCIITLSFCKPFHEGVLKDPLIGGYFLVGVSSSLRFDYRHLFFGIILCPIALFLITYSDFFFHGITPNLTLLSDVILSLAGISLAAGFFIRKLRDLMIQDHQLMEKQVKEVSSILDICRNISSRKDIEKMVKKVLDETVHVLQADLGCIFIQNGDPCCFEHFVSRGDISGELKKIRVNIDHDPFIRNILAKKDFIYPHDEILTETIQGEMFHMLIEKENVQSFLAVSLNIDGQDKGVFIAANRSRKVYPDYEKTLAGVLLEQVSISARMAGLLKKIENRKIHVPEPVSPVTCFQGLIGKSREMVNIYEIIERASKSDIPVLITGESGTGKELVANALKNLSARSAGPFIKINCASIPGELLESELFGHEKGAFTGAVRQKKGKLELAHKGTLFLDEIGDMPLKLQVKLLRVLQENEFERVGGAIPIVSDFRLITATNQHIEDRIVKGEFRQDLFYRINGLPIRLPSLRSRADDIPALVEHFLFKYGAQTGLAKQITQAAIDILISRDWRGNVRELENFIYRLVTIVRHDTISEDDIEDIDSFVKSRPTETDASVIEYYIESSIRNRKRFQDEISNFEKCYIKYALMTNEGNISKAGRMIGLPKTTLYNKMKKYDLH